MSDSPTAGLHVAWARDAHVDDRRVDTSKLDGRFDIELARKHGLDIWLEFSSTSQAARQLQGRRMLPPSPSSRTKKRARIVLSGASSVVFVREATPIIWDEGGFQQGAGKAERSDCEPGRVAASNCLLQRMIGTRFSGLTDSIR